MTKQFLKQGNKYIPKKFSKKEIFLHSLKPMAFLMNSELSKPAPKKLKKVVDGVDGVKESEVLSIILKTLKCHPLIKVAMRLNAGKMYIDGHWIKLADKGTADCMAILEKEGFGYLLFIETKRSGSFQSLDQAQFEKNVSGMKNVFYILTADLATVKNKIHEILFNQPGEEL